MLLSMSLIVYEVVVFDVYYLRKYTRQIYLYLGQNLTLAVQPLLCSL
jgi:hypothetical protein